MTTETMWVLGITTAFLEQVLLLDFITQGQYPYKGLADEWAFKIGTGATQSDVDAIWNSGNGAAFDTVIASPDQYLKFNEATSYTGSTVADSSGNGNSMTMNNFTGTPFVPH